MRTCLLGVATARKLAEEKMTKDVHLSAQRPLVQSIGEAAADDKAAGGCAGPFGSWRHNSPPSGLHPAALEFSLFCLSPFYCACDSYVKEMRGRSSSTRAVLAPPPPPPLCTSHIVQHVGRGLFSTEVVHICVTSRHFQPYVSLPSFLHVQSPWSSQKNANVAERFLLHSCSHAVHLLREKRLIGLEG